MRLVAPDQVTAIQKGEVKFHMKDPQRNATTVLFLQQLRLSEPGLYFVEVMVDDVMKVRYPFPVMALPQKPDSPQRPSTTTDPE
jgi:hypothetical protein